MPATRATPMMPKLQAIAVMMFLPFLVRMEEKEEDKAERRDMDVFFLDLIDTGCPSFFLIGPAMPIEESFSIRPSLIRIMRLA